MVSDVVYGMAMRRRRASLTCLVRAMVVVWCCRRVLLLLCVSARWGFFDNGTVAKNYACATGAFVCAVENLVPRV